MNYTQDNNNNQVLNEKNVNFLFIPSVLDGFENISTSIENNNSNHNCFNFCGKVRLSENDIKCKCCGEKMHIHSSHKMKLKHLPFGSNYSQLCIDKLQLKCSKCGSTQTQDILFKATEHLITNELKKYIEDLLAQNNFTNKEISYITGVNRNIIKDIDKKRLMKLYTINGEGKEIIKPEKQAKYLGIDEFKLHDGYKYATHIIDLETGHILWIAEGKKKQVVYDFINHVGNEWMKNVIAIACDMNSDFEEAFKEKCPNIKIVYDYFHIVKNLNEKVIGNIRKDEQKRLIEEGDVKAAKKLKGSRFILTSSEETLKKKDRAAEKGQVISKSSELFNSTEVKIKGGRLDKYTELISQNELFLIIELIKELLLEAFKSTDENEMVKLLFDIMELCEENGNKHLVWFEKLIYNHFDGIITHATHRISSGKIEGINNRIKTLRRQSYGYPDDEYFFLKLFDMSRN